MIKENLVKKLKESALEWDNKYKRSIQIVENLVDTGSESALFHTQLSNILKSMEKQLQEMKECSGFQNGIGMRECLDRGKLSLEMNLTEIRTFMISFHEMFSSELEYLQALTALMNSSNENAQTILIRWKSRPNHKELVFEFEAALSLLKN